MLKGIVKKITHVQDVFWEDKDSPEFVKNRMSMDSSFSAMAE